MRDLIKLIKKLCNEILPANSCFIDKPGINGSKYVLQGSERSEAIGRDNETPITIHRWFEKYWLYLDIRFDNVEVPQKSKSKKTRNLLESSHFKEDLDHCLYINKNYYRVFVFVTVFYGEKESDKKTQLFRAEWDSYPDNKTHPQPHWHFHQQRESVYGNEDFDQVFDDVQEYSIEKIHFAMNGQWAVNNGECIHHINDGKALARWLAGLLTHIQLQLMYHESKEKKEHISF
jgi:hypothetical protein